jgi:hypothetical protein
LNGPTKLVYVLNPSRITDACGNPFTSTNPLPVNVVNEVTPTNKTTGTIIDLYQETPNIAAGVLTTLITYTAPMASKIILERISVSGDNIALFTVLINNSPIDKRRTSYTKYNDLFNFISDSEGLLLSPGDVVTVQVLHNRPTLGIYDVRLQMSDVTVLHPSLTEGALYDLYSEALAVPANNLVTILTYMIPIGLKAVLEKVSVSGENKAQYFVLINGNVIDTKRSSFTEFDETFNFFSKNSQGLLLNGGDTIQIQTIHQRPDVANFESRVALATVS